MLIIPYQALQLVTPMRRNPRVGVHGKAVHTGTARSREYRAFPFIPQSWANPSHVLSGPLPKGGKVKGLRTEQQRRYYWGVVVKLIADYTGNDIDTIHEFFKDKFALRKTITVQDEARTIAGCTHDLFKENFFEDYIDHIRVWAISELSLVMPNPQQVTT